MDLREAHSAAVTPATVSCRVRVRRRRLRRGSGRGAMHRSARCRARSRFLGVVLPGSGGRKLRDVADEIVRQLIATAPTPDSHRPRVGAQRRGSTSGRSTWARAHGAFMARVPTIVTIRTVRAPLLTSTYGPLASAASRQIHLRDAEAPGSNPGIPTTVSAGQQHFGHIARAPAIASIARPSPAAGLTHRGPAALSRLGWHIGDRGR